MQPLFLHPRDLDLGAGHLFWAGPADETLAASIRDQGQLTPALVLPTENRPILVAGSRRADALRRMRGRTLAAVAFDPAGPPDGANAPEIPEMPLPVRLGLAYLASNLGRTVTEAMAVAAGRFFLAHQTLEVFWATAGPYLLPPGDRRVRQVSAWLALPPALDGFLASGHLPLAASESLAGQGGESLAALTPLLGAVRWSRANLENLLAWLTEAARLSGESGAAVLARSGVLELPGKGLSPNDLTAGLLAGLRRRRYPTLTDLESRFTTLSRGLVKGTRLKLRPSQGFEADALTVEVKIRRPSEAAQAAADLGRMAGSPDLERLLHLGRGDETP